MQINGCEISFDLPAGLGCSPAVVRDLVGTTRPLRIGGQPVCEMTIVAASILGDGEYIRVTGELPPDLAGLALLVDGAPSSRFSILGE